MDLSRVEHLCLKMRFDPDQAKKFKKNIEYFGCSVPKNIEDTDTIVSYDVLISYFGQVADKLEAIAELQELGIPVEAEELVHGECLIQRVLKALGNIKS